MLLLWLFIGMLPPNSDVSMLMSNNLLINLSLFITLAEFALFFCRDWFAWGWDCERSPGPEPVVNVDTMCSTSLKRNCFLGWYKMHDLLILRRSYFLDLEALRIGFFICIDFWLGAWFVMLLKCWVAILDDGLQLLFGYFLATELLN